MLPIKACDRGILTRCKLGLTYLSEAFKESDCRDFLAYLFPIALYTKQFSTMLVIAGAIVLAVLCVIAYFAGFYKKGPGDTKEGETIP